MGKPRRGLNKTTLKTMQTDSPRKVASLPKDITESISVESEATLLDKLNEIGNDIKGIKSDISGIQTDISELKDYQACQRYSPESPQ